jgi:hypothetical protein
MPATIADYARNRVREVRQADERILEAQGKLNFQRERLAKLERPYRLMVLDGKTADIRDAQREQEIEQDAEIQGCREGLRELEYELPALRIQRDAAERLYKIALAELRTDGVER